MSFHFSRSEYIPKISTPVVGPVKSITDLKDVAPSLKNHMTSPGPRCIFHRVILPQCLRSLPIPVNMTFYLFVNQETFACKFVTQSSPASTSTLLSLTNLQEDRLTSSLLLSLIVPWKSSLSTPRLRSLHDHPSGDGWIGSLILVGIIFRLLLYR